MRRVGARVLCRCGHLGLETRWPVAWRTTTGTRGFSSSDVGGSLMRVTTSPSLLPAATGMDLDALLQPPGDGDELNSDRHGQTSVSPWASVDLTEIQSMGSKEVRKLAEAAAALLEEGRASTAQEADLQIFQEIAARCMALGLSLEYWDVVLVLQAFTAAGVSDKEFFMSMAEVICSKTSKLSPKRILDVLAVFEAQDLRPRALYVELFHALIRLARSMYPEELSLTLQLLARHSIGNPTVVAHLARAARQQIADLRLRYLCGIVGALGSLEAIPMSLLEEFDERARMEVETVAVQELLDNIVALPRLEYSWLPYEELCQQAFLQRIAGFEDAKDVGQLKDPFEVLHFLQSHGWLEKGYLEVLAQWCLKTVHLPNVLSHKRPTAQQLVLLHDLCSEWEVDRQAVLALDDAIAYFVESGGGQWPPYLPQPRKYALKRRYIRKADPMDDTLHPDRTPGVDVNLPPAHAVAQGTSRVRLIGPDGDEIASSAIASSASSSLPTTTATSPSPLPAKLAADLAFGPRKLPHGGETTNAFITSRQPPGPRGVRISDMSQDPLLRVHRRDPTLPRYKTPHRPRLELSYKGGYMIRPKYKPGVATARYPWADEVPGKAGGGWVLRR